MNAVKVLVFVSLNKDNKQFFRVYVTYQSNQWKMNTLQNFVIFQ